MSDNQEIHELIWFFGRGASAACGLDWIEPRIWRHLHRDKRINCIKTAIGREMKKISIGNNLYSKFISKLEKLTELRWKHRFITTNWDYLLQREILNMNFTTLPAWLSSSHVFHLNGSAEPNVPQDNRTVFLLETDSYKLRKSKLELIQAVNFMLEERLFVVVGASFRCGIDISLLDFLTIHEDNFPYGEATTIILDPDEKNLRNTYRSFKKRFPRATLITIQKSFQDWMSAELPELAEYGVIRRA